MLIMEERRAPVGGGGEKGGGSSGSKTSQGILRVEASKSHRIAVQVRFPLFFSIPPKRNKSILIYIGFFFS